ncbi:MAG TPA: efflux RND transporter periplasmic adaptor subunit [Candidatus Krumholzibacteria bacterium]|nr:efflux RND transporter periplasmic adaptor subunit [Candidatus Krumholzibacteria bacterium]
MFRILLVAIALLVGAVLGCGKKGDAQGAADSTATDSTSLANAKGSMESDGENFGQSQDADASADTSGAKAERRERAINVNAARAIRADLVRPVIAEGQLRARHSAEIRAEVAGKIMRIGAEEGQAVKRGALLVKIDDREYEMALEESRARYLQALSLLTIEDADVDTVVAQAKEVRDQFADLERLEKSGKITREERLAREIGLDVQALKEGKFRVEIAAARSGVSVARADLERARLNLERTEVRAPFDGVVSGLTLSTGEQLMVNQVLFTLVDNVNIEAEVGVLEADVGKIAPGGTAILAIPALGDTIPARVDVVSPQFNRETRTCQVLMRLKNSDGRMRPGMFARALIAGERFEDRLLVPREAVLTREGRPLVFKVEGDRAKWLYVEVGASNDHMVEITGVLQGGTLEPDDRVVVSDHLTLAHDAKIKVRRTVASGDPWVTSAQGSE